MKETVKELTVMDRRLSLAHLTLLELPPPQLVSVAAAAGFTSVGIRISPVPRPGEIAFPVLGDTPLRRETEQRLADTGLTVLDVEVLTLTPTAQPADFEPVFETAARLGAEHALVWCTEPDEARATDVFAGICQLAAQHGIRPVLEFARISEVKTIQQCIRMVETANQPNGGLLVDALAPQPERRNTG